MESALEITNLRKGYKKFTLKDVSFTVPRGYIMGLVGPNGAGKTTIIKLIMNLIRKDGGRVRVFGQDNLEHEPEVKERIGFVYDVPPFYDDVPLKTIKSALAPFYPRWNEGRFESLIREFDLPLGKAFKKLSHGMKMKFSLALALSHDADLVLMDEPTSGLDPAFRLEFLDRLSALLQDENKAVLFSTHITSDLERVADYITFIHEGEIVFSTSIDDIKENWAVVKAGRELANVEGLPGFKGFRRSAHHVEVLTSNASEARRVLPAGAVQEKASLDDIMYYISRGESHA